MNTCRAMLASGILNRLKGRGQMKGSQSLVLEVQGLCQANNHTLQSHLMMGAG
jgi:hypothetical protein